jgi:hypothetical protein
MYYKVTSSLKEETVFQFLLHLKFQIWEEYHKHKEVIAAAIPSMVYDNIHSRSQQFPIVSVLLSAFIPSIR